MADILIRGMEMPTGRVRVLEVFPGGVVCDRKGNKIGNAVQLPQHGRCIDADAFKADCLAATKDAKPDFIRHEDWLKSCAITMSFCRDIDEQPTIVPAEGGGEECSEN